MSLIGIPSDNALQAQSVVSDSQPPSVREFDLDLNSGILQLYFDETIRDFNLSAFALQNNDSSQAIQYTLISSVSTAIGDVGSITIQLTIEDLNNIKALPLCDNSDDCYLSYTANSFFDRSGLGTLSHIDEQALPVDTYRRDEVSPVLESFVLIDLGLGRLVLSFSEPVNSSTFDPSGFVLRSLFSTDSLRVYPLTSADIVTDGNLLNITLNIDDYTNLMLDRDICSWRGNCYISANGGAILDPAENPLVSANDRSDLIVTQFIPDTVPPILTKLDLNTDILTLTFTEAVDTSSFDVSGITLQNSENASELYSLTSSTVMASSGQVITIKLSSEDANMLKNSTIARNESTTFLSLSSSVAKDLALDGNPVEMIDSTDGINGTLIPDITPPSLSRYTIDINENTLTFSFDETINTQEIDFTGIRLLSTLTGEMLTLSGDMVVSSSISDVHEVTIQLTPEDIVTLKSGVFVGLTASNAMLTMITGTVVDTSNNRQLQITLASSELTRDTTRVSITEFNLDMVQGILNLTFDDVVNIDTLDVHSIILQSNISRDYGTYYRLTDSSYSNGVNSYSITIQLGADLLGVKSVGIIGNDVDTTYLTVEGDLIDDTFGVDNVPITDGKARRVTTLIPDEAPLLLLNFSLNVNDGELTLTFDDIVDIDTFDVTGITVQNSRNISDGDSYTLFGGGEIQRTGDGTSVFIQFSEDDLNGVKSLLMLGALANNTFISIVPGAVSDSSGNFIQPISIENALPASVLIPDNIAPVLNSFVLDLNRAYLRLNFSETVNRITIDPTGVTIQNSEGDNVTANLTFSAVLLPTRNSAIIDFGITAADFERLISTENIATNVNNTYLAIERSSFTDTSGNPVVPIRENNALQAVNVIGDMTGPSLLRYDFSLDDGTITFTFSEAINISTLNIDELLIQSRPNSSEDGVITFMLNGGTPNLLTTQVVELELLLSDLNNKNMSGIATNSSNTFITFTSDFISDFNNNSVTPVPDDEAMAVETYEQDTSSPEITNFTLNLEDGTLVVSFDERFIPESINISQIFIQDGSNAESSQSSFSFNDSTVEATGDFEITITLSEDDLNQLKAMPGLGFVNTTFISITSGALLDLFGNEFEEQIVAVEMVTPDTEPPVLEEFSFDANVGQLYLTFSETVDASSLDPTGITLQGSPLSLPGMSYTLTEDTVALEPDGVVMTIQLSPNDQSELERLSEVATDTNNTFIVVSEGAITDTSGNLVVAVTMPEAASSVFIDMQRPMILGFDLDLSMNVLILHFSEIINTTTFNPMALSLQNHVSNPTFVLNIINGTYSSDLTDVLYFSLLPADLLVLKTSSVIARSPNTTFLAVEVASVYDLRGFSATGYPTTAALCVSTLTQDTAAPRITEFDLNLYNNTITVRFDEAINESSFDPTKLIIQNRINNPILSYPLTGGAQTIVSAQEVVINLTPSDVINLKQFADLCTNRSNCFITGDSILVSDILGNVYDTDTTAPVNGFVLDIVDPEFVVFDSLDLNTGLLQINFTEPVLSYAVQYNELTIQSWYANVISDFISFQLTGGSAQVNGASLIIQLNDVDFNFIKMTDVLCDRSTSCWITFTRQFVQDITSNPVVPLTEPVTFNGFQYAQRVILDTKDPVLVDVLLDFDENNITLVFDEVVDLGTFNPTALTFTTGINSTVTYTLQAADVTSTNTGTSTALSAVLTEGTINRLKSLGIGITQNNTAITFTSTLIEDLSENNVSPIPGPMGDIFNVTNVEADEVRPAIALFYEFNLNEFTMTIQFTEPVALESINITGFVLQSGMSAGDTHVFNDLDNATYVSEDHTLVAFTLQQQDIVAIKLGTGPGTTMDNTYLYAQERSAFDLSGLPLQAIGSNNAIQVSTFISDTESPSLLGFALDINSGILDLTFDDVVDVNTLQASSITLRGDPDVSTPNNTYMLTGGSAISSSGFEISVALLPDDLNAIKERTALATNDNDTYIQVNPGLIADIGGSLLQVRLGENTYQADQLVPDTSPPEIVDFTVDLHAGLVMLVFSEVVDVRTLNTSRITLQNDAINATAMYTLTGGTPVPNDTAVQLSIYLTEDDLNLINRIENLATDTDSSYLTITDGFVTDFNNNEIENITEGLPSSAFRMDMLPPTLTGYDLDVNMGILQLTFSETVNSTSLNVSAITIQNSPFITDTSDFYNLTDGNVTTLTSDVEGDHILLVELTEDDLNELKARLDLATAREDTFITVADGAVVDSTGNAVRYTTDPVQASNYTVDTTPPELISYSLNLNNDSISLTFSETVLPSTFNPEGITILSSPTGRINYTLSSSVTTSPIGPIITVQLSEEDSVAIKSNPNLGRPNTTYLSITPTLIQDAVLLAVGNISVENSIPLQLDDFTSDIRPPMLQCFTLDLNADRLVLTFSESVDISSLDASSISFQSSNDSDITSYRLTGAVVNIFDTIVLSTMIEIEFATTDINAIKVNLQLAVSRNSTFIVMSSGTITDSSGNGIQPVLSSDAFRACNFTPDERSPELLAYDLIMIDGVLPVIIMLRFSEPVSPATLQPTTITFHNNRVAGPGVLNYTLTNGVISTENSSLITINMTEFDFSAIKLLAPLLEIRNSSYLSIANSAFFDLYDNPGIGISDQEALQVDISQLNFATPTLLSFKLDLNEGLLGLTFNEEVDEMSLNLTLITIQNSENSRNVSYKLTSSRSVVLSEPTIVNVQMSQLDVDSIKSNTELAVSRETTWISASSGFIRGINGNPSTLIPENRAIRVSQYTPDFSRPELVSFDFYLNSGIVSLTFTEAVRLSTFEPSQLTFQNRRLSPTRSYTLTGGNVSQPAQNEVSLQLSETDQYVIKSLTDLLVSDNTTFLSVTSQLIEDVGGNALQPIRPFEALNVSFFGEDMNRPYLRSFVIDLSREQILLTFNETVNGQSLNPADIQLVNDDVNATINYTLQSSTSGNESSALVSVQLSTLDASEIKRLNICSVPENCYLTHTEQLVVDIIGMMVSERNITDPLQAEDVIPDRIGPRLVGFDLDVNDGIVTLLFSEAVDVDSLDYGIVKSRYEGNKNDITRVDGI